MIIKKSLLLSYLLIFAFHCCYARWGNTNDAPIEVKSYDRNIYVNKDGTAKEIIETRIKLLNHIGRDHYSNYRMTYNYNNSKIKIIEAKTIINGKEYSVNKKSIEDKSLASTPEGFDDTHQILIVFPNVDIGAELLLKYEQKLTHPPLENFFETAFIYGLDGLWTNSNIQLSSEIPFFIHINDPQGILNIKQYSDNNLYHLEINQKKSIFTQLFNETNARINPKYLTIVHLSTIKTWKEFAARMKPLYLNILQQQLPSSYKEIAEKAAAPKTLIDKINKITSMLAEKIRYMGDWRSTDGRFVPRDLDVVNNTQYGDCKDLATATAVILKSIGIEADLALITRGSWVYEYPSHLAGFRKFNHVIVRVKDRDKYLWIDPTNVGSMAGKIFFDISNRKSLVLTNEIPTMDVVPIVKPQSYLVEITEVIDLKNKDYYKISGELYYRKKAAYPLTASALFASKENIEHHILNQLGDTTRMSNKKLTVPKLTSRIVKDLKITYEFNERSSEIATNAGQGIMLSTHGLGEYLSDPTRISDLFLGQPNTLKTYRTFRNIQASKYDLNNVKINSPWLDIQRKINYGDNFIKALDIITVKKPLITQAELQSEEYLKMHKILEKYFANGTAIIFKRSHEKLS